MTHKPTDIRCKGTKTTQDLLDEYFGPDYCSCWIGSICGCSHLRAEKKKAIEKELGMDRIRDERVRRLEERLDCQTSIRIKQGKSLVLLYWVVLIQCLLIIINFLI